MTGARARRIDTDGGTLYLEEHGAGEPVLLLHGMPANGHLWDDVAPTVARDRRVIVVDLIGFGRSARRARAPVDVEHQAAYVLQALDALDLERVALVGHDIGGAVAQVIAVDHPDRASRLLLINAAAHDLWPVPAMKQMGRVAWLLEWLPPGLLLDQLSGALRRGFSDPGRAARVIPEVVPQNRAAC